MAKGSWTHYRRNTPSGIVEWVEADDGETIISGSEAREYFPLLAAAPDLLYACEAIMRNHEAFLREEWAGDWIVLRDAIAKAKGRPR